ncbi:hypothetical protein AVEN_123706-1 [Araneus ventricosus]|uniref:Uncharacterized protein n=1 Tax=Araneus ventricosus TaxID=182803 RepID=A0A4Y2TD41_ARAVE|nr:hypothetical protein AVEN_123706-1 [Araneus ventricosus]
MIPNYIFYRNDRQINNDHNSLFGGTCIYIKSHIDHHCVPTPELESMDATIIEIKIGKILKEALAESSTQKFKDPPEKLPLEIRNKIHLRNYLRRQWQRTRDPEYRREFYKIKDEVANETKQHLLQKLAQQTESLTPESRTLWRRSQLLRKPFTSNPPLRGETGDPALAPIEKAEAIADSLRKQFEPNTDPIFDNPILSGKVKEAVENFINTPHINNLSPATASEVSDFIKTLKPNKSPALDQITAC